MVVALRRGARFELNEQESGEEWALPDSKKSHDIAQKALWDITEALGLNVIDTEDPSLAYGQVLEAEREKIWLRLKR